MKQRILRYMMATLILSLILCLVFLLSDTGYVYIYIWQWQIQTSLLSLCLVFLILGLGIYVLAQIGKRLQQRAIQKRQSINHFDELYHYEKNGILYLLKTHDTPCEYQFKYFNQIYAPSVFLKPLIKSYIAYQYQHYDKALQALKWVVPSCFELKEMQLVQIYLAQRNAEKSLTHLLVLEHPKQAWLNEINDLYQTKLDRLWAEFAGLFPIAYLQQQHQNTFTLTEWQNFSQALLEKLQQNQSSIQLEQLNIIQPYYQQYKQATAKLWYQIYCLLDMTQAEQHFDEVMSQYFDENLFNLWFIDYFQQGKSIEIQQYLQNWQAQYPSLPCLQLAQIIVSLQQQQYTEIEQILSTPQEHYALKYLQNQQAYLHHWQAEDLLNLFYRTH